MKSSAVYVSRFAAVIAAGVCLCHHEVRADSSTNAPTFGLGEIPLSVFVVANSPKEGRNPFFPQSVVVPPPAAPEKPKEPSLDTSAFVLNGITSPPKRTAMINGRTFEEGEEGEVRLPTGSKTMIRCAEIKSDSAVIIINGQRRELRMRMGI